jgi:hypothetical protein
VIGTGGHDALDFSEVEFLNNSEGFTIEGGNNHDTITLSEMSDGTYVGGHGNDSFVVGVDTNSATITDFNDIGNDVIDLSEFGVTLGDIAIATTDDGTDTTIDLEALGGEAGATVTLLGTLESELDFTGTDDFTI